MSAMPFLVPGVHHSFEAIAAAGGDLFVSSVDRKNLCRVDRR